MNLNQVQLLGRLGRRPEMRTFPDGSKCATVSIATTEWWRDRETGAKKEATEWHDLVFTGSLAELVDERCDKGSLLFVQGSLRTRKWKDKDTGLERSKTEVRVNNVQLGPVAASSPANGKEHNAEGHLPRSRGRAFHGDPNDDDRAPF